MVAIVQCWDHEADFLRQKEDLYALRRWDWNWSFTRPRAPWAKGRSRRLLLIAARDDDGQMYVTHVGKSVRGKAAKDQDQQLTVSLVFRLAEPLRLTELLAVLAPVQHRRLAEQGHQTDGVSKALRDGLLRLRPAATEAVKLIEGAVAPWTFGENRAAQEVALQRDATLGAARMAGFDATELAEWDPPAGELDVDRPPPTFLALAGGRTRPALEDHLIARDAETMLGWLSIETSDVAWREFREHGRTLLVANANRTPAETLLGCDIVYYNVTRESLVLVQYKKLDAARKGFYYPSSDRQFGKELRRMKALDRYAARVAGEEDEQRLDPSPSWVKLCHPQSTMRHTNEMIHGMYFSRRQFESLRRDARLRDGRGGAVRFGYQNVPGYLDNTLFSRLVESGQIGTSGTSTELVRQQVIRTFRGQRNLVLAALSDDTLPQAERNRRRRGGG
ncbi:hypothetical protein [Streptomyces spiramenti]|uniref:Uncharacterized protein n=1 Tax=Streptomyces spiramenti TaxID=2720606 RepID=A0ABX1AKT0_9ACTN|nr:hypothetical protein [Streptomyces spiramenti]NJP65238.1 hypothetical protein [Streptomyces spiramenti]